MAFCPAVFVKKDLLQMQQVHALVGPKATPGSAGGQKIASSEK